MKVRIRRGAADEHCPCNDWLKHWERAVGRTARGCGAAGCTGAAEWGAHVITVGGLLPVKAVVPLCERCRRREDEFQAREPLAPATRQSYCGMRSGPAAHAGDLFREATRTKG